METEVLKVFTAAELKRIIRLRDGEKKLGEKVLLPGKKWQHELEKSTATFVIIGIPEDIGVRANMGRPGTHSAYKPALTAFLNQQDNFFLPAESIMVLGEVAVSDLMRRAEEAEEQPGALNALRQLVEVLDERVSGIIKIVVAAGKVPVVIGGGHNNAYGNIRGASEALRSPINVINCDTHLDFRRAEGRHSGNGFSYAYDEGYLTRYAVLCMHEQYNNRHVLERFRDEAARLHYESFESIFVRGEKDFGKAIRNCISFIKEGFCGVELDLDAISNVPSSARTSSGIFPDQARQYVSACAGKLNCVYLHIAEAAPVLSHLKADIKTGKLIAYLVSDFMKAYLAKQPF